VAVTFSTVAKTVRRPDFLAWLACTLVVFFHNDGRRAMQAVVVQRNKGKRIC
jgi:hypothetical protein